MCGIAYIYHKKNNLKSKLALNLAKEFIDKRGPDYNSFFVSKNEFIFQSVLSIQSNKEENNYKFNQRDDCFLYNGEIYSEDVGLIQKYDKTIDSIKNLSKEKDLSSRLRSIDGMYAICKILRENDQSVSVEIYRDPSGEKHLYYYKDSEKLVISSVPGFIKEYCNLNKLSKEIIFDYLSRRHLITSNQLCIDGIKQLKSGHKIEFDFNFNFEIKETIFKGITEFFDPNLYLQLNSFSIQKYENLLDEVINSTSNKMVNGANKNNSVGIISGGIDSSLSAYYLNKNGINLESSFCLDFNNKEIPTKISKEISIKSNIKVHNYIKPDIEVYKDSLERCIRLLAGPINTHSFASSMIIAREARKNNARVIYGGEGADELFLGYGCYGEMISNFNGDIKLISDYSKNLNNEFSKEIEFDLNKDLFFYFENFKKYMSSNEAFIKASALVDYYYQLSSVGFLANDLAFSDYGIEARSIFGRSEIIRLALSTPVKFLISTQHNNRIQKQCLHNLFIKNFKLNPPKKSGFAGFPNETKVFLGSEKNWKIWDVLNLRENINEVSRERAWKLINLEWFFRSI